MKKILKSIKSFFLAIWKFIDKKIILPITKLVLGVTGKFDNSGKSFENWLSKRNTLLFISLFFAFAIFLVIDRQIVTFSRNSAEVLRSLPVTAIYNEEAYVVEGLPETVDITLIGSKTDLFIAKQMSSYDVTVDLTGLKPGQHKVNIKYNQSLVNLKYMVNPTSVNITIRNKVSQTKSLSIDILNKDKLDSKLVISNTSIESDKVIVKGSQEQIDKVAVVKALLDVEDLITQAVGNYTINDVPLKAYDSKGNIVDVEIIPGTINVDIEITSPSKEVPIKVIPKGTVAFGKAISSLDSGLGKITLYGDSKVLDNINYLPVEVDVSDLKDNKEYKVDLTKPVGITYMSTNSVTVTVTLGAVAERDITNVIINKRNLASGYSVSAASTSDAVVTVNLKGVSSVIEGISSDSIVAYVDLSGLSVGTHEVEVKIDATDARVTYTPKTKKVTVTISK